MSEPNKPNSFWKPEFVLVSVMLIILTVIVAFIIMPDIPQATKEGTITDKEMYKQVMDYRKDLLSIILTAFGAWVGAGAAYFFGRENLRESANSLLALHKQLTGKDKLATMPVKDIQSREIKPAQKLEYTKTVADVMSYFKDSDQEGWFLMINDSNRYDILTQDQFYNTYLTQQLQNGNAYDTLKDKPVREVLDVLKGQANYIPQHIEINREDTVAMVDDALTRHSIYLALIKETTGVPKHYFTTSDIRKALLRL